MERMNCAQAVALVQAGLMDRVLAAGIVAALRQIQTGGHNHTDYPGALPAGRL